MVKKVLFLLCAVVLVACSDDNDDPNRYIEGTKYGYNINVKSDTYVERQSQVIGSTTTPKGTGEFVLNENRFEFEVSYFGKATITKLVELNNPIAVLPAFIDDVPVYYIGKKLFYCNKDVSVVVIPYTVVELRQSCLIATPASFFVPDKPMDWHDNIQNTNWTEYKYKE